MRWTGNARATKSSGSEFEEIWVWRTVRCRLAKRSHRLPSPAVGSRGPANTRTRRGTPAGRHSGAGAASGRRAGELMTREMKEWNGGEVWAHPRDATRRYASYHMQKRTSCQSLSTVTPATGPGDAGAAPAGNTRDMSNCTSRQERALQRRHQYAERTSLALYARHVCDVRARLETIAVLRAGVEHERHTLARVEEHGATRVAIIVVLELDCCGVHRIVLEIEELVEHISALHRSTSIEAPHHLEIACEAWHGGGGQRRVWERRWERE
jgi:hypothetical protein